MIQPNVRLISDMWLSGKNTAARDNIRKTECSRTRVITYKVETNLYHNLHYSAPATQSIYMEITEEGISNKTLYLKTASSKRRVQDDTLHIHQLLPVLYDTVLILKFIHYTNQFRIPMYRVPSTARIAFSWPIPNIYRNAEHKKDWSRIQPTQPKIFTISSLD